MRPLRAALTGLLVAGVVAGCSSGSAHPAAGVPPGTAPATAATVAVSPAPADAALPRCTPPRTHPEPVVLLHGTFATAAANWRSLAPILRAHGYCVYALDYGLAGVLSIETSAHQLDGYVHRVLDATGARRVDLVGHSQGGLLGRYWALLPDSAGLVDDVVGLGAPNHGTTVPLAVSAGAFGCASCPQMAAGSAFLRMVNALPQHPPGVSFTVVATRDDTVVVPYTSAFLAGATDVTVQDDCPADRVSHGGLAFDPVVAQWVLNALDRPGPADPDFHPSCG